MKKAVLWAIGLGILGAVLFRIYGCTKRITKVVQVEQCQGECNKHKHPSCVISPATEDIERKIQSREVRQPAHSIGPKSIMRGADKPFKSLILLADFEDKPAQVPASFFDNLLLGDDRPSVKHHYLEDSKGQFTITTLHAPSQTGWFRMPKPYSFYVDSFYGLGYNEPNATTLVKDLVAAADGLIDYSDYDSDRDGIVDALIMIHSGSGAEFTGSVADIWSHRWNAPVGTADGVWVSDYCTAPEYWAFAGDMTIGVYAHEFGHLLGLPDLYGTEFLSGAALGRWSLMATGSWNGTLGSSPAHLDAWSKDFLGFQSAQLIHRNGKVAIGPDDTYKLQPDRKRDEYWLVENRQRTGYDDVLPGSGLIIYHIDDRDAKRWESNKYGWWPESPYPDRWWHVAIEQADGRYDLDHCCTGWGDAGDPWPGTSDVRNFEANFYINEPSGVSVKQISDNGQVMMATLSVKP